MSRVTRTVAIIGAGPAGLALASMLQRCGIDSVVLERQSRAHVERRQRAGVIEHRVARMLERWDLLRETLRSAPSEEAIEFRVDGVAALLPLRDLVPGRLAKICPQQILVRGLIEAYVAGGGDLRFEATATALHDIAGTRPSVTYRDATGAEHEIECRFIAGCDGEHGISRSSVPPGSLSAYQYDHGVRWLTVIAEAQPPPRSLFVVSRHGFAAQFPRGTRATRLYLQFFDGEDAAEWSGEEVWRRLRLRLGEREWPTGPIVEMAVVDMRSVVHDPPAHGRLYLVGDAAHLIPPMGGKGMNLALNDADVLARALWALIRDNDDALLRAYPETALRRVWECQAFSAWMSEVLHDAGDGTGVGPFRRELARARLDRLFTSPDAATAFAQELAGSS